MGAVRGMGPLPVVSGPHPRQPEAERVQQGQHGAQGGIAPGPERPVELRTGQAGPVGDVCLTPGPDHDAQGMGHIGGIIGCQGIRYEIDNRLVRCQVVDRVSIPVMVTPPIAWPGAAPSGCRGPSGLYKTYIYTFCNRRCPRFQDATRSSGSRRQRQGRAPMGAS